MPETSSDGASVNAFTKRLLASGKPSNQRDRVEVISDGAPWAFVLFDPSSGGMTGDREVLLKRDRSLFGSPTSPIRVATVPANSLPWIAKMRTEGKTATTPKQLVNYIVGINSLIRSQNFELLDSALATIKPSDLSVELMVTVVRSTYSIRRRLKNWTALLSRVKSLLAQGDERHRKLLSGFDEKN
jgi:hypothetical protein